MAIVDKTHSQTIEEAFNSVVEDGSSEGGDDGGSSGGSEVVFLTSKIVSNPNYDAETSDPSEMFCTYIFNGDTPVYVSEILTWMREGKLVYVAQDSNDPDNRINEFRIAGTMTYAGWHPMDYLWYAECFRTSMYELTMDKYTGVSSYYDDEGTQIELPDNELVFMLSFSKSISFPD